MTSSALVMRWYSALGFRAVDFGWYDKNLKNGGFVELRKEGDCERFKVKFMGWLENILNLGMYWGQFFTEYRIIRRFFPRVRVLGLSLIFPKNISNSVEIFFHLTFSLPKKFSIFIRRNF